MKYLKSSANDGYHNKKTYFRSYFLSFDSGAGPEIMNKPVTEDPQKTRNRTALVHIAFGLGSKEAVDALSAEMQKDGCRAVSGSRVTGDGYYESCAVALEGNQIELTV